MEGECLICGNENVILKPWLGRRIQCGHKFCVPCTLGWFQTKRDPCCPLCRNPTKKRDDDSSDEEEEEVEVILVPLPPLKDDMTSFVVYIFLFALMTICIIYQGMIEYSRPPERFQLKDNCEFDKCPQGPQGPPGPPGLCVDNVVTIQKDEGPPPLSSKCLPR